MNPFQIFVKQYSFHYKSFLKTMAEIAIRYDSIKKLSPEKYELSAMIHEGIDKSEAKKHFSEALKDASAETRYAAISEIANEWGVTHTDAKEMVIGFIQQYSPLPVDIEDSSYFSRHTSDFVHFIQSISRCASIDILEALLMNNEIDLNTSDHNEKLEQSVSIFSFLVDWQVSNRTTSKEGVHYLSRLLQEPIDKENPANKHALYHLFLNPHYARVLSAKGFSLYDATKSHAELYDRIPASSPNYAVSIMRDIFNENYSDQECPEILQYKAAIKKEDSKNPSLLFKPFFDNKMITEALFHFVKNSDRKYKTFRIERSTDSLVAFFESYLGEGWLWDNKPSGISAAIRKLEAKKLTYLRDHILTNTSLKTLIQGIKKTEDVKLIANHRNIMPYDMLFETNNSRIQRVITEALDA